MNWKILCNPLSILGRKHGIIASAITTIILAITAWWGWIYLDGALDLHVGGQPHLGLIVVQSLIAWLSLAALFFAISRLFHGDGGFLMHLSAAGLGRAPYIFASIAGAHQVSTGVAIRALASISDGNVTVNMDKLVPPTALAGLLMLLLFTAWSIGMLYVGFKTASHMRGSRAALAFTIAVALAEIASKFILVLVGKAGLA